MHRSLMTAAILLLAVPASMAQTKKKDVGYQSSWFRDIVIQTDESANDVICYGCNVRVLGQVRDDIVTFGGDIDLEGNVGVDAVAMGGRVHVGPNVHVDDDADAFGGYVTQDSGAEVKDEALSWPYFFVPGQTRPPLIGIGIVAATHALFVFVFAGILGQRRVENINQTVRLKKGWILLWGAIGWIAAVVLFYVCWVIDETRWGDWGMVISGGIVCLAVLCVVNSGLTGLSVWIGRVFRYNARWMKAIFIGTIVILVLELIPRFGFIVFVLAAWLSMGAALVSRWRSEADISRRFADRGV
ncbi:MAG TPA: hypothetical protein VJN21_10815 [Candidatus Acidoferrales bacterium]|nr:hypothetical protein [Candidatus Acidoferrales bacterium]